jgi:hypothetical protein
MASNAHPRTLGLDVGVTETLAGLSRSPQDLWLLQLAHQYLEADHEGRKAVLAMAAHEMPAAFRTAGQCVAWTRLVDAVSDFEFHALNGLTFPGRYCHDRVAAALAAMDEVRAA